MSNTNYGISFVRDKSALVGQLQTLPVLDTPRGLTKVSAFMQEFLGGLLIEISHQEKIINNFYLITLYLCKNSLWGEMFL